MSMVGLRDVLFVTPAGVGAGAGGGGDQSVIPLLSAATPYHLDDRNNVTAIHHHLWQQQQPPPPFSSFNNPSPNLRKPTVMPLATMLESSASPAGMVGGGNVIVSSSILQSSSSSGAATCQDCGNQAKKDCTHRRCRTCCKGRGFDCSTHVKSTWVSAARRRESQLSGAAVGCNINIGSSGSTSTSKKPRLAGNATTSNTSNSNNTTPPRSFETSSSHQEERLPGQVSAPAVFKCVKVTSIDDGEGEYAYQAMVRIGGHIFKGFLYDQGLKDREEYGTAHRQPDIPNKNITTTMPNLSELHLGGGGGGCAGHGNSNLLDGGGTAFGNNIN